MNTGFKDHFSIQSAACSGYRPRYPGALLEHLAAAAAGRRWAWDCATGNGQAATGLAGLFSRVVATDASLCQLARAEARAGVDYVAAAAERSPLGDGVVDLVTVAQALHWFDLDDLIGFLGTWSAVQRYKDATGSDPVAAVAGPLARAWGAPAERRTVTWDLTVRLGRREG